VTKQLWVLVAAGGCILLIAPMLFLGVAEVRQWLPVFLVAGAALAVFGVKGYRDT
jgi:hypothetical protein